MDERMTHLWDQQGSSCTCATIRSPISNMKKPGHGRPFQLPTSQGGVRFLPGLHKVTVVEDSILEKWAAQGPDILPILSVDPEDQAIENSIITACGEEHRRRWMYELGAELQAVPTEEIDNFRDRAWLRELKKAYQNGSLAKPMGSEAFPIEASALVPAELAAPVDSEPSSPSQSSPPSQLAPTSVFRRGLPFPSARCVRQRCQESMTEPVEAELSKIEQALDGGGEDNISDVLYCDSMFVGLEDPASITATLVEWLSAIVEDSRAHYEIAGDTEYGARHTAPLAWHAAVQRVADARGYNPECFSLLLDSNVSWCENPETTLTHEERVRSYVSPPQACNIGMPASHRKTDQEQCVSAMLFEAEGPPDAWREGQVLMTDGTKKGTENLLLRLREGMLSWSESANTVLVPGYSDKDSGISYFTKQRLCQWTQSEAISTSTGHGQTILLAHSYKFGCRMLGQNEVAEGIMRPTAQCLQKRLAYGCVPEHWLPNDAAAHWPMLASNALLQGVHGYLVKHALPARARNALDEFALAVYDAVAAGVASFLQSSHGRSCSKDFRVKLMFYRSDLLRQTNIVMRIAQGITREAVDSEGLLRSLSSVDEIVCALWRLRRQWHLHHALYKYFEAHPMVQDERPAGAAPRANVEPALDNSARLRAAILTACSASNVFSITEVRKKLKPLRHPAFNTEDGSTLAQKLLAAFGQLAEIGLLKIVAAPQEVAGRSDGKWNTKTAVVKWNISQDYYAKTALSSHEEAAAEMRRALCVSVEHFPS